MEDRGIRLNACAFRNVSDTNQQCTSVASGSDNTQYPRECKYKRNFVSFSFSMQVESKEIEHSFVEALTSDQGNNYIEKNSNNYTART